LRNGGYWASHMRTFKLKLYKELTRQDPNLECYKDDNGNFFTMSCDVATTTPLMEIAGLDRIKFNSVPIYYYRIHSENDHFIDASFQKELANIIFKKNKFIYKYEI
jgi:hypothetical protein